MGHVKTFHIVRMCNFNGELLTKVVWLSASCWLCWNQAMMVGRDADSTVCQSMVITGWLGNQHVKAANCYGKIVGQASMIAPCMHAIERMLCKSIFVHAYLLR